VTYCFNGVRLVFIAIQLLSQTVFGWFNATDNEKSMKSQILISIQVTLFQFYETTFTQTRLSRIVCTKMRLNLI
jgi:hypothetical protein